MTFHMRGFLIAFPIVILAASSASAQCVGVPSEHIFGCDNNTAASPPNQAADYYNNANREYSDHLQMEEQRSRIEQQRRQIEDQQRQLDNRQLNQELTPPWLGGRGQ